jgi:class 3 adenylate cyclase
MRPDLPTGTVTFLFTDIEGSTRLLHALGTDEYAEALADHRRLLREAFAVQGGVEVDTQGDAFFFAFPTATGAAVAARTGHQTLAAGPIRVRIGLHTGAPSVTDEGYVGVDVHRGARIASVAHGGQTIVSAGTAGLLDGAELRDLGLHRLKDFDGAVRLYQLGAGTFPAVRTPGSVELPTPATAFLGREAELLDAASLVLEHDPRLLTIVGPGGTGKTRFAIELARLLAEDADGGTLFLPFASIRDPSLVLPTVADALGAESAEPTSIGTRVGEKRTTLVLDNLEQLLPDAATALASLTEAAPGLRLLATSREALRIGAETQFDLPPLHAGEAVELFLVRARAVRHDIHRTPAVDELCSRLDRLPLAIELAAARAKLLSPEALLERPGQRLDLPAPRDADPRHATLRATIAWSYDLLDPAERRLFARLAVFPAGCTLADA